MQRFSSAFRLGIIVITLIFLVMGIQNRSFAEDDIWHIYFEDEAVWQVFDHDGLDPLEQVLHYDGSTDHGYGYDGHQGIDYSIVYEPVLAAGTGRTIEAGWDDPANHRIGKGLRVIVEIDNSDYQTIYGHLSTISTQIGDEFDINYSGTGRIIGIGGNTGFVFNNDGPCGDVVNNVHCGAHLHFETRRSYVTPPPNPVATDLAVNPYGWLGEVDAEPISVLGSEGRVGSENIWRRNPNIRNTDDVYPDGSRSAPYPEIGGPMEVLDNSGDEFEIIGNCWAEQTDTDAWGNGDTYHRATVGNANNQGCVARWNIDYDALFSDENDVFVHLPDLDGDVTADNKTLGAIYTIVTPGGGIDPRSSVDQAIIVQAAYPNADFDDFVFPVELGSGTNWAFIGRYTFTPGENFIEVQARTFDDDEVGNFVVADAVVLVSAAVRLGGSRIGAWQASHTVGKNVRVTWQPDNNDPPSIQETRIYRGTNGNINDASLIYRADEFGSGSYDDTVPSYRTYYYWMSQIEDGYETFLGPKRVYVVNPISSCFCPLGQYCLDVMCAADY